MSERATVTLGLIALLLAAAPALAASSTPRATPAAPDPAQEQAMRGLRTRFALQQSDSGLLFRVTKGGFGPRARPSDTVTMSFQARLMNGTRLSSLSVQEKTLKVSELIPGLAEAAQMLALGGRATLCVMPHLSFADGPWPKGVRPGSPIFYEVEVHAVAPVTE